MKPGAAVFWPNECTAISQNIPIIQTKDGLKVEGEIGGRIVEFIENQTSRKRSTLTWWLSVGRYVLSADIWEELERTEPGAWGRIQLTDAIAALAKKQSVDAMLMTGELRLRQKWVTCRLLWVTAYVTIKKGPNSARASRSCWRETERLIRASWRADNSKMFGVAPA